ncbi:hypothetical protein Clacol_002141 [Clathrus columnatus]|uniref:Multidrug and toxin extrusion protein n=1 Tax=Clathrus columnatus TaxID=1419009 RepID=A0AAV4ZZY9_9AGAM|nr:hypothetical protein Clacol_002141 [Clathrus columnatus]
MLQNSIQTATIVITGRLGPDELSAAAFAMMLATVTGWCIALGGTTALDTLGSQAYTFSNRNPTVIIPHLLRCIFVLWILLVPVSFLWFFISPVLLFLGQNERLSNDVQTFLRILILGAPAYIGFESVKKYLQCQGIMHASTFVLLVTSPSNAILSYFLVNKTSLGFRGAPISISTTYHFSFLLIVLYARYGPGPPSESDPELEAEVTDDDDENPTMSGDSDASITNSPACSAVSSTTTTIISDVPFSDLNDSTKLNGSCPSSSSSTLSRSSILSPKALWGFTRLALPGILMVATEWWAFEIVALAAGRLGRLPLAAQGVVMTADQILNTLPFGLSVSASARIGNLIGARKPLHAKLSAHTAALLSRFGYLFSDDQDVVRLVASIMPLVASFQVADGLANSCGGVLRGQGRQHLGAAFNLIAYYVLALPFGLTLAFHFEKGLHGLWIGQVIALFIVGFGEYIAVWRFTDWAEEVRKGIERIRL